MPSKGSICPALFLMGPFFQAPSQNQLALNLTLLSTDPKAPGSFLNFPWTEHPFLASAYNCVGLVQLWFNPRTGMASNSALGTALETICSFVSVTHWSNVMVLRIRLEDSLLCDFPVPLFFFFLNAFYLALNIILFFPLFQVKAKKSPVSASCPRTKQAEIHLDPRLHLLVF